MFYSIGIQLKIGKKYWIGQDIHSGFSITLYGKNPEWLFWPTQYLVSSKVRVILKYTWRFLLQKMRVIISYLYWQRQRHPTPVLLPGKSHGRRSLAGCSPWVAKSQTWLSNFTFTFHFYALEKDMATHSSVLAWRIPGMGSHRVEHDWSDLAVANTHREEWT